MSTVKIPIVYHKHGILVVDKPFGLASQPTRDGSPNLFSALQNQFPYVALHHRLDTPASGLLLLCTDRKWNQYISAAFQHRKIKRDYWIACLGTPPSPGTWNYPLYGKQAVTHYRDVKQCFGYSCLRVSLETGRKHQIRLHAQKSGHPILGDRRYGGSAARLSPRLALHAQKISFIHPATQKECTIESPLPEQLHSLLSK
jgi:23S rRNA-/tRNA-specific pseudouridylate synthase